MSSFTKKSNQGTTKKASTSSSFFGTAAKTGTSTTKKAYWGSSLFGTTASMSTSTDPDSSKGTSTTKKDSTSSSFFDTAATKKSYSGSSFFGETASTTGKSNPGSSKGTSITEKSNPDSSKGTSTTKKSYSGSSFSGATSTSTMKKSNAGSSKVTSTTKKADTGTSTIKNYNPYADLAPHKPPKWRRKAPANPKLNKVPANPKLNKAPAGPKPNGIHGNPFEDEDFGAFVIPEWQLKKPSPKLNKAPAAPKPKVDYRNLFNKSNNGTRIFGKTTVSKIPGSQPKKPLSMFTKTPADPKSTSKANSSLTAEDGHTHVYELKSYNKIFKCSQCLEEGLGTRFRCDLCADELHEQCKVPNLWPFRHTVKYHKKPISERVCDACTKVINGYFYHCEGNVHGHGTREGYDLHPCCMNLKPELHSGMIWAVGKLYEEKYTLMKEAPQSSKCYFCHKKKLKSTSSNVSGWAYASACRGYCFHIHCVREAIHETCVNGNYVDINMVLDDAMKLKHVVGSESKTTKVFKEILEMILRTLLGDPTIDIVHVFGSQFLK